MPYLYDRSLWRDPKGPKSARYYKRWYAKRNRRLAKKSLRQEINNER